MDGDSAGPIDTSNRSGDDLSATEAVYQSLFERSGIAHAEVELATWRFVGVNRKFCEMVGHSATELLGGLSFLDITHPDDRDKNIAVVATASGAKACDFDLEVRCLRVDSQVIWVRMVGALVRNADRKAVRFIATAIDITPEKGAEDWQRQSDAQAAVRQRQSDAEFRAVFDQSSVGMTQISVETQRFVRVNAKYCELTGYSAAELARMTPEDLTFAEDLAADAPAMAALLSGAVPVCESERRQVRKDGEIIWIHNSATLLRDADDRPERIMSVIQDITHRKEAEAHRIRLLQDSEWERGRLSDVFRHAPAFMCVLRGPDHIFELANDRYNHLVGHREILGRTVRETLPELEGQGFFELLDKVYATGEKIIGSGFPVLLAQQPDQAPEERYVDFVYQALRDPTGTVSGILVVGVDVTDRSRAEAAVRSNEVKYRTLFDSIDEGYCVIEMMFNDTGEAVDYLFLETNPAFEKQSGMVGATGRTMRELVPDIENHWFKTYGRVAQTGEPERFVNVAKAMGRWFDVYAFRLGGAGSNKVAILFTDITARMRVEEALRESEERYRTATVAVSGVIWTNNAHGLMEGEQRGWGEFTGQAREDYQGYGWATAVHPEDAQATINEWTGAVAEKRTFVFEHRIRRHDGEWRVCSIRAVPVLKADGAIREWVGVHTDITERKRDEEKLRQLATDLSDADRKKDEFLATLAHELRNPLAPIRTGLDVMRMSPGGTPTVDKARAMMERQLGHLVRLVDDLMDVSRINSGKIELKVARVQARAIVDHAVEASRPVIDANGHKLVNNVVAELAWVAGDLTRLAQVVSNLINNAAKYTPTGGQIELAAAVEAGQVVITVADNGVGISADMLPHVFDLFAQVDRTLDRAQGGLGIGLSVVRKLVELHGGTVTAASPGIGLGSTFTVRLPLAATAQKAEEQDSPLALGPSDRLRVLVVDDNVDGAEMLSEMLELAGHEARAVHDGVAALAAARDVRPDVVFLDIGLPGMGGHEVARLFRAEAAFAGIVLVALTGWGSEEDKRKSREAGFDHHVTKPLDFKWVHDLFAGINGVPR